MNSVTPEDVGLSSKRLSRIRPVMQRYIDQKRCAGVLTLIARRGQIAHLECTGLMDIQAEKPMREDTIFRIYSMSKAVTCAAALMLYEEGKFRLDEPVSAYIPAFKNTKVMVKMSGSSLKLADQEREMTIRDLFTHTSGLSYGFDRNSAIDEMYRELYKEFHVITEQHLLNPDASPFEEVLPVLAKIPLAHQPGTVWHYSISIDVLGYLIEELAEMALDVFLKERMFNPLNMEDTDFYVPPKKLDRLAAMYKTAEDGGLELLDPAENGVFSRPHNLLSGGGGLVSTAEDYLRFATMLLNKGELNGIRLLSRKIVEFMTMNHLGDGILQPEFTPQRPGYGFGLGVKVLKNVAQTGLLGSEGTFGWSGIAGTDFWVDPREDLIGIIMPQHLKDPSFRVATDFRILTYQAIAD